MSVSSDAHPFPKSNTIALPHNPALERPTGIAPAAIPKECYRPQWINTGSKVDRIVELISRFINCDTPDDQFEAVGRHRLTLTVARYVETGETMELVFPGFPFKSTSRKKVLGTLPDLAEEILLRRLDMLAQTISDYHPAGAMIHIVSDGVVYQGQNIFLAATTVLIIYDNRHPPAVGLYCLQIQCRAPSYDERVQPDPHQICVLHGAIGSRLGDLRREYDRGRIRLTSSRCAC